MRTSPDQTTIYFGLLPATPLGDLWLAASSVGLVALDWAADELEFGKYLTKRFKRPIENDTIGRLTSAYDELTEYLAGKRRVFNSPLDWSLLRPFQQAVLKATFAIPYGETRAYGDLAKKVGRPRSARAVGRAEATNPLPLFIPCHRVIGADGKLHGYGGGQGLPTKEWLLRLEGVMLA